MAWRRAREGAAQPTGNCVLVHIASQAWAWSPPTWPIIRGLSAALSLLVKENFNIYECIKSGVYWIWFSDTVVWVESGD